MSRYVSPLLSSLPHYLRSSDALLQYFTYVESLFYADKPDYDYCRSLFQSSMESRNEVFDEVFDWSGVDDIEAGTRE